MNAWGILYALLLVAVPQAPISLTSMQGAPLVASLAPGERALVLHFWATWCPDCKDELPVLDRAAARCANAGVRVLLVNVGESADEVLRFATEQGLQGFLARDPRGAVWRHYAPAGLPANVTWTPDGLHAEAGPRDEAAWTKAFAALGCDRS